MSDRYRVTIRGDNMTAEKPITFRDLPLDSFPFTIRFLDSDTDEVLHTIEVTGGGPVHVPAFAPRRVDVEITFPGGRVERERSPEQPT